MGREATFRTIQEGQEPNSGEHIKLKFLVGRNLA
jgi:hypothetical protein